jgi:SAM-dependent methyltransferase
MPAPLRTHPSLLHRFADHLFFPLNMWLSEETSFRFGLTPIDHERVRMALPYCCGKLLDVGCGNNLLVKTYGNGIGVDFHPYAGIDACCDGSRLPFKNMQFDTVALLACLNHITRRKETLEECRRVLRDKGTLVLTMIPAWVGRFSHPIRKRHDPDQLERGISADEKLGLSSREIRRLFESAGFRLRSHKRFMWNLNNLYVAEKL